MDLHLIFEANTATSKSKDHFVTNIEKVSIQNRNFREVLYTSNHLQVVVMSIPPGGDIGMETHKSVDQFIRVEEGSGKSIFNGKEYKLTKGAAVVVPQGTEHNIVNTSDTEDLSLYTVYGAPNHEKDIVHKTQKDAEKDDEKFAGKTDV